MYTLEDVTSHSSLLHCSLPPFFPLHFYSSPRVILDSSLSFLDFFCTTEQIHVRFLISPCFSHEGEHTVGNLLHCFFFFHSASCLGIHSLSVHRYLPCFFTHACGTLLCWFSINLYNHSSISSIRLFPTFYNYKWWPQ